MSNVNLGVFIKDILLLQKLQDLIVPFITETVSVILKKISKSTSRTLLAVKQLYIRNKFHISIHIHQQIL